MSISDAQSNLIANFAMAHPVAVVFLVLALAIAVALVGIVLTARKLAAEKPDAVIPVIQQMLTHNNGTTDKIASDVALIVERQETILKSVASHDDVLTRLATDIDNLSGRVQSLEDLVCRNGTCPNRVKQETTEG